MKNAKEWDQLIDILLLEELRGETPPDLTAKIIARINKPAFKYHLWIRYAAAACFCGLIFTLIYMSHLSKEAEPTITGEYTITNTSSLQRGSEIQAKGKGATLSLGGYVNVSLKGDTKIKLSGSEKKEKIYLTKGEVRCSIDKNIGKFAVVTDLGAVSVKGTEFIVKKEETPVRKMFVKVISGAVLLSSTWGNTVLHAGEEKVVKDAAVKTKKITNNNKIITPDRIPDGEYLLTSKVRIKDTTETIVQENCVIINSVTKNGIVTLTGKGRKDFPLVGIMKKGKLTAKGNFTKTEYIINILGKLENGVIKGTIKGGVNNKKDIIDGTFSIQLSNGEKPSSHMQFMKKKIQTMNSVSQLLMVIRMFQKENGELPSTLEEITPYIDNLPDIGNLDILKDSVLNKPFIYRPLNEKGEKIKIKDIKKPSEYILLHSQKLNNAGAIVAGFLDGHVMAYNDDGRFNEIIRENGSKVAQEQSVLAEFMIIEKGLQENNGEEHILNTPRIIVIPGHIGIMRGRDTKISIKPTIEKDLKTIRITGEVIISDQQGKETIKMKYNNIINDGNKFYTIGELIKHNKNVAQKKIEIKVKARIITHVEQFNTKQVNKDKPVEVEVF